MLFELKVALRFLKSGKTQTLFILFGIALGVSVQIFLGSLITSLQDSLVQSTIGNQGHISIAQTEDYWARYFEENVNTDILRGNYNEIEKKLDNWEVLVETLKKEAEVTVVSPLLQSNGLVQNTGKSKSIIIKGIRMEEADSLYNLSSRIVRGDEELLGNYILIGDSFASDLGYAIGDNIQIRLPNGNTSNFNIKGIFDLENEAINESWIFMDLERSQRLLNLNGKVSRIEIQLEDPFLSKDISEKWKTEYENVSITEWQGENEQLLTALASQGSSSYTIQFFVIVAITFGIASVLAVSVIQKSKEIGILKAMGVTSQSASRIFIYQGFMLGSMGSVIGAIFGIGLIGLFSTFSPGLSFGIEYKWSSIIVIILIATTAGVISSVIPARRSAKLNPMEAINNG